MTTERLRRLLNTDVNKMSVADMMDATEHEKREFLKAAKESANRDGEALRVYQPLPFQQAYHESTAKEVLLAKGNRAGGPQPLTSAVLGPGGWKSMGDIRVGDVVIGESGPCKVVGYERQGVLPTYCVTFDDGSSTMCAATHPWKAKRVHQCRRKQSPWGVHTLKAILEWGGPEPPKYKRAVIPNCCVDLPRRAVPLDPYLLGVLIGDGTFTDRAVCLVTPDEDIINRVKLSIPDDVYVKQTRAEENYATYRINRLNGTRRGNRVMESLEGLGLRGKHSYDKFVPLDYLHNSRDIRVAILQGLMDTDGSISKIGHARFATTSIQLAEDVASLVRSLGGKASIRTTPKAKYKNAKHDLHIVCVKIVDPSIDMFHVQRKKFRQVTHRDVPYRIIRRIDYVGMMECACLRVDSEDHTYITDDYIVTHNSMAGFAEDARALTGQDPYNKYPEKNGTCVTLGYGENHIGRVIHKFLFRSGSFKMIRDVETGLWRPFRPWPDEEGGDQSRADEAKEAPPLIPPRYIDTLTWEKRGDRVFSLCIMTTGWELFALNSAGDPSQAQGFDVDLYHIDEDTAQVGWYEEAVGRTAITKGKIRWTALPHSKNDDILNMMQRAEEHKDLENPTTVCLRASMFDNPYYPKESRDANLQIWAAQGEDVVRKRAYGELVLDSILMYPTFSKWTHDIVCAEREKETPIQRLWRESHYTVPETWCCDMIVDPGHTIAAALFIATPPPSVGDFHVIYEELYIHQCTADILASQAHKKVAGRQMERFIIDAHGGRLTDFGSGVRPQRQYEKELANRGVRCNHTGNYFINGSDDILGREEALRRWLHIKSDGSPTLYVDIRKCPNFVREMSRFKKKQQRVGSNVVTLDEANRKGPSHLCECAEYGAANGLSYVAPRHNTKHSSIVKQILKARADRETRRRARTTGEATSSISLAPRGAS